MEATVGRVVHYKVSSYDAANINARRADFQAFDKAARPAGEMPAPGEPGRTGHVGHFGNEAAEGDVYPAVVVRTFHGTTVNLKVLLDGNDDYWATSRGEGDGVGFWHWPERV